MTPQERAAMNARLERESQSGIPIVAALATLNLSVLALHDRITALELANLGAPIDPVDALGVLERLDRLERGDARVHSRIDYLSEAIERVANTAAKVMERHHARIIQLERNQTP